MKLTKKDNILIILARGGSKRIPNKNIRKINGIPLIHYSINAAIKSKLFDKIHISTDSEKIKKIVEKTGLIIDFKRPKSLSGDNIPIIPVVKYVVNKFNKDVNKAYKNVFILSAINPFIDKEDIRKSFKYYLKKQKPVLGICEYPAPIQWAFKKNIKNQLKPVNKNYFLKRSQDLEKHYFDAGAFSIHKIEDLNKTELGYDDKFIGYKLERDKSIDIDEMSDLKYVRKILKKN